MTQDVQTDLQRELAGLADELAVRRHVPVATYRLQLHSGFTFADAAAIIDYLNDLGVGDLYASPFFVARAGSTHGYDVSDYSHLSPALGGEEQFAALSAALRQRGMGLVLDMVPNHMGIGDANPWWLDVLENGPASPYAAFFDIDWHPVKPELAGKVLLPILGDQYGSVLERRELHLELEDGTLALCYDEIRLPVAPHTMLPVLEAAREAVGAALPEEDTDRQELESIITALGYLPPQTETDPERLVERRREKDVIRRRISGLSAHSDVVRAALADAVSGLNGRLGDPRSFDALDALIQAQPYRLAFWRVAAEEINYRRFFDINDLAAIRVELPEVFAAAHELVFRLIGEGSVNGLRIDHPDGLWNPPAYFVQLQERYLLGQVRDRLGDLDEQAAVHAVQVWAKGHVGRTARGEVSWPLYVVAEKILSEHEPLPQDWAVDGTTGYDFLNLANGIFVDSTNKAALDSIYRRFIAPKVPASAPSFASIVYAAKQEIMDSSLSSEITSLSHQLERINEKNRRYRDFTLRGLTSALTAVIAELSIYRTYITDPAYVSQRDVRYVDEAVRAARRRYPRIPGSLFSFMRDTMLLRNLHEFREEDRQDVISVVMRLQQMTGPVMAKSVEDTAFYRYHRLISLNEVGGHPEQFGHSVVEFHRQNAERRRFWPHAMLTLATHDTKRGEDVRARINVLSELPGEWEAAVTRWSQWNARHKTQADSELWPDNETEYLLYQTLVGAWPFGSVGLRERPALSVPSIAFSAEALKPFAARITQFMQKATSEAKLYTSWLNPNEEYDAALAEFIAAILSPQTSARFLGDLDAFAQRVSAFGRVNSLAQTLLKLTSPGVPDTYQGTELWDLQLVDPDNRRMIDYDLRRRFLAELTDRSREQAGRAALAAELLANDHDGRIKLYLVAETLRYRRAHLQLFAEGAYTPLDITGAKAAHVCAFARSLGRNAVIVAVPRLALGLVEGVERPLLGAEVWGNTAVILPVELAGGRYRDLLTGRELDDDAGGLALADIFAVLPVALLERIA